MLALPGKDPNKIRSEHPSRLIRVERSASRCPEKIRTRFAAFTPPG
jgi:hypothetical protein